MGSLENLMVHQRWEEIALECERLELIAAEAKAASPHGAITNPPYAVQMLCYLIVNRLIDARFLWMRVPKNIKENDVELQSAWRIGRALWDKNYASVNHELSTIDHFSPAMQPLVKAVIENHQKRQFALISRAYSAIRLEHCCLLTGTSNESAIQVARQLEWEIEPNSNTIRPKFAKVAIAEKIDAKYLHELAKIIGHLEE